MLLDERQNQILSIIKGKVYASVDDLAKTVFASPATIRRDLVELEKKGIIKRVRGGASVIDASTGELAIVVRKQTMVAEKKRMALSALPFIKDGASCFLDSSTTAAQLIPLLAKFDDLVVITNGIENAALLASCTTFSSFVTGGEISPKTSSTIGTDAIDFIKRFNCDLFVFSCHGLSIEGGVTEGTIDQQRVKEAMLKRSAFHILLADHTKFGNTLVAQTCPLADLDVVVTDEMPSQDFLTAFKQSGVRLIVAGVEIESDTTKNI